MTVSEQQEWLRRYADRIRSVTGMSEEFSWACARAETFEVLSDMFEDDPEGAADEEMSYWDGE